MSLTFVFILYVTIQNLFRGKNSVQFLYISAFMIVFDEVETLNVPQFTKSQTFLCRNSEQDYFEKLF